MTDMRATNRLPLLCPAFGVAKIGGVPERPKGSDCKSDGVILRRFESYPLHQEMRALRAVDMAGIVQW